jgi:outer membrane protein OmpU
MKNILLATTVLVATVGIAAAEVTLSGDARMGVVYNDAGDSKIDFTSRARVTFTLSGETDNGLSFGASFKAGEAGSNFDLRDDQNRGIGDPAFDISTATIVNPGADNGGLGSVFIAGSFGKLSMGDVDSAADAAVGNVNCIALKICGIEEINKQGAASTVNDPVALYEYSTGGLTFFLSMADGQRLGLAETTADDPATEEDESVVELTRTEFDSAGVGVKYATDAFAVGLGYEYLDDGINDGDQISISGSTTFAGVSLKAVYAMTDGKVADEDFEDDNWAISAGYTFDAVDVSAFYRDGDSFDDAAFGLGASYDMGGGASLVGGVIDDGEETKADFGVTMSF